MNEKEILARYRALRRWVERERQQIEKSGKRKSQRYLLRSRLADSIDPITLRELVREFRLLRRE